MARRKLDFSEYERDAYENYLMRVSGIRDISMGVLDNDVWYDDEDRCLHILVDRYFEWPAMEHLMDELEGPSDHSPESTPEDQKEDAEKKAELFDRYRKTFGIEETAKFLPDDEDSAAVNVFSGTELTVPLGEGILNFCDTDFQRELERAKQFYFLFSEDFRDALRGETPELNEHPAIQEYRELLKIDPTKPTPAPEKIRNKSENILNTFEHYTNTMLWLDDVLYSSLYTAVFPPVINQRTVRALEYYENYLNLLQTEFRELLEFCFDETFEPETLGRLCPTERYSLWCHIKDRPASFSRSEDFTVNSRRMSGSALPFGMPMEEFTERVRAHSELTDAQRAFAEKRKIDPEYLEACYRFPRFLRTSYSVKTLRDMLHLEFSKLLEQNVRIKKCGRCGRYFMLKGNYTTEYCSRVEEGGTRTCQQLAAQENYRAKVRAGGGENAWGAFQRYYKRYFARARVGTIKEPAFKQWQYEAVVKRDQCSEGTLPLSEYLAWLDASFPNRQKKEKPQ